MKKEDSFECLEMFKRWIPQEFIEEHHGSERAKVFSSQLVLWLLVCQRLFGGESLQSAVERVALGAFNELTPRSGRAKRGAVSSKTGGYSQGRTKLDVALCEAANDEVVRQILKETPSDGPRTFAIDGTTIRLSTTSAITKKYPTAENQNGRARHGILHTVVAHDLQSGCALRPEYGAMFGENLKTEHQLTRQLLTRIPKGSILVGDRNFGISSTIAVIKEAGMECVLRLASWRAKRAAGREIKIGDDLPVAWTLSKEEQRKYPDLAGFPSVPGRIICSEIQTRTGKKELLILFTTLREPPVKLLAIYAQRWNLETDLRTLKQVVHLETLSAKTPEMVAKELLMGIVAYNLVRALILLAAQKTGKQPRQFSFSSILSLVQKIPYFASNSQKKTQRKQLPDSILKIATQRLLPVRKKKEKEIVHEITK